MYVCHLGLCFQEDDNNLLAIKFGRFELIKEIEPYDTSFITQMYDFSNKH